MLMCCCAVVLLSKQDGGETSNKRCLIADGWVGLKDEAGGAGRKLGEKKRKRREREVGGRLTIEKIQGQWASEAQKIQNGWKNRENRRVLSREIFPGNGSLSYLQPTMFCCELAVSGLERIEARRVGCCRRRGGRRIFESRRWNFT